MPMSTRKTNAVAHPGYPDRPQIRRTSKQVEEDKAKEKAAATMAREKEQASRRAALISIAQIEDRAEEEEQLRLHSNRPDLWYEQDGARLGESNEERSPTPYDPHYGSDQEDEAALSPPASTIPNSSFSHGADHGHSGCEVEAPKDSDEEMGVHHPGNTGVQVQQKIKRAEKTGRGSLRAEIGAFRSVSESSSLKRKATTQPATAHGSQGPYKCLKRSNAMIGGLIDNWQKQINPTPAPMRITSVNGARDSTEAPTRVTSVNGSRDTTEEYEDISGGFQGDEPRSMVGNTRENKSLSTSRGSSHGPVRLAPYPGKIGAPGDPIPRRTAQMGLSLMRITPSPSGGNPGSYNGDDDTSSELVRAHTPGPKGKRSSLRELVTVFPSCPDRDEYIRTWHKYYVPRLLSWAGAQEDPFGTNCRTDVLSIIWHKVFPDVPVQNGGLSVLRDICDTMLMNWRSEIGKAGRAAVIDLFNSDDMFKTAESRRDYVSDVTNGLRFIYKNPDVLTNRGAFRSDLVSVVYANHLRKITAFDKNHTNQIGALALATVAVERGLSLFETGEDAIEKYRMSTEGQTPNGRNRMPRRLQFGDNPWGGKARLLTGTTKKIDELGWTDINACASRFLLSTPGVPEAEEGAIESISNHLYSQIDLDW